MRNQTKERLKSVGFQKEVQLVETGNCPICGKIINMDEFRDELSLKEFEISGICMSDQDKIFGYD